MEKTTTINQPTNTSKPFRVLADRTKMTHEEWLKLRLGYLNCSELSSVLGLNPFQTANQLWAIKAGITKPDYKDSPAMEWGRYLEPVIRNYYAEKNNCEVKEVPYILQSIDYPWLCGNLDGVAVFPDGSKAIIEIKTGNYFCESDWGDNSCPPQYLVQLMMYEFLTGIHTGYLVSLIAGQLYHCVKVEYNHDVAMAIINKAKEFWYHVQTGKPLPTVTAKDNAVMASIFPISKTKTIELPKEFSNKLAMLASLKQQQAYLKDKQDEIEAEIKQSMGEAESAICGDYKISWKTGSRTSFSADKAKSLLTENQIESCMTSTSTRTLRISNTAKKATKSK